MSLNVKALSSVLNTKPKRKKWALPFPFPSIISTPRGWGGKRLLLCACTLRGSLYENRLVFKAIIIFSLFYPPHCRAYLHWEGFTFRTNNVHLPLSLTAVDDVHPHVKHAEQKGLLSTVHAPTVILACAERINLTLLACSDSHLLWNLGPVAPFPHLQSNYKAWECNPAVVHLLSMCEALGVTCNNIKNTYSWE